MNFQNKSWNYGTDFCCYSRDHALFLPRVARRSRYMACFPGICVREPRKSFPSCCRTETHSRAQQSTTKRKNGISPIRTQRSIPFWTAILTLSPRVVHLAQDDPACASIFTAVSGSNTNRQRQGVTYLIHLPMALLLMVLFLLRMRMEHHKRQHIACCFPCRCPQNAWRCHHRSIRLNNRLFLYCRPSHPHWIGCCNA